MNLKEIKQYSRDVRKEIRELSQRIHPKLLSVLQFPDIWDESLNDNNLLLRYNREVYPLVQEYQNNMKEYCTTYIERLFADILEIDSDFELGVDLRTGQIVNSSTSWKSADDFLPSPDVAFIFNEVQNLHQSQMNIRCFWEYPSVTITSANKVHSASNSSTPQNYIQQCRTAFGNEKRNAIHQVFDQSKKASYLGYEIHVPPLNQYDERAVLNNGINVAITRHLKLKDFLEGSHNKSRETYVSTIDLDAGTYKFTGRDY